MKVLFDRMGRLRRAEAICEAVVDPEFAALLGEVLHGLAWTAKAAGEAPAAIEASFVKAKGVQSGLPLATTLDSLANHLMVVAKWGTARDCLDECLAIRSDKLMKYHPDNAAVHVSLGRWNQLQQLYDEAFAEFEQAAHIYAHAVGAWHVRAANAYHFLAEVLLLMQPSARPLVEACRCSRLAVHIRCTHYARDAVQVTKSLEVFSRAQVALAEFIMEEDQGKCWWGLCQVGVAQGTTAHYEQDGDALYEALASIDFTLQNDIKIGKHFLETERCAEGRAVDASLSVVGVPTRRKKSTKLTNGATAARAESDQSSREQLGWLSKSAHWLGSVCCSDSGAGNQPLEGKVQALSYCLVEACLKQYRAAADASDTGPTRATSFSCAPGSRDLVELDLFAKIQLAEEAVECLGQQYGSFSQSMLTLTPFYESSGS